MTTLFQAPADPSAASRSFPAACPVNLAGESLAQCPAPDIQCELSGALAALHGASPAQQLQLATCLARRAPNDPNVQLELGKMLFGSFPEEQAHAYRLLHQLDLGVEFYRNTFDFGMQRQNNPGMYLLTALANAKCGDQLGQLESELRLGVGHPYFEVRMASAVGLLSLGQKGAQALETVLKTVGARKDLWMLLRDAWSQRHGVQLNTVPKQHRECDAKIGERLTCALRELTLTEPFPVDQFLDREGQVIKNWDLFRDLTHQLDKLIALSRWADPATRANVCFPLAFVGQFTSRHSQNNPALERLAELIVDNDSMIGHSAITALQIARTSIVGELLDQENAFRLTPGTIAIRTSLQQASLHVDPAVQGLSRLVLGHFRQFDPRSLPS